MLSHNVGYLNIFDKMNEEKPNIDQNALSRQLAVYGHEAQGKLMAMKVFLYGVTGVKNFIITAWY